MDSTSLSVHLYSLMMARVMKYEAQEDEVMNCMQTLQSMGLVYTMQHFFSFVKGTLLFDRVGIAWV
jgi:hypothetical protein